MEAMEARDPLAAVAAVAVVAVAPGCPGRLVVSVCDPPPDSRMRCSSIVAAVAIFPRHSALRASRQCARVRNSAARSRMTSEMRRAPLPELAELVLAFHSPQPVPQRSVAFFVCALCACTAGSLSRRSRSEL